MQSNFGFWARAFIVPAFVVLCAYGTYVSPFGSRTIFVYLLLIFLLIVDIASLMREPARGVFVVFGAVFFGLCLIEGTSCLLESATVPTGLEHVFTHNSAFGWGAGEPGSYPAKMVDLRAAKPSST